MSELLTLYCNCFHNHENRFTQFNQKNLICGSSFLSKIQKNDLTNRSFLFDDTGDNISNLNPWLGDLTGLYWVWKNTDDEFVGTNQYRRFWHTPTVRNLNFNERTLYISNPFEFNVNVWRQYISNHGIIGLQILKEATKRKTILIDENMIDSLNKRNILSPCNMFFSHREIFDKLCSILFEIISELYRGVCYSLPYIQTNGQTRLLAYLSERILNIIYLNKKYFLGDVDIVTVKWINGISNDIKFE